MSNNTQLVQLAKQVMVEHSKISTTSGSMLAHAIAAGKLLEQAKQLVPKGGWVAWMEKNLDIHKNTAFTYIRLAKHETELAASKVTGIDPAMDFLSSGKRLSDQERQEMISFYSGGAGQTLEEIAEQFGVTKSVVWYHVSAKNRDRIKTLQKKQRARAQRALEREDTRKEVSKVGGLLGRAYAETRRATQAIDQHLSQEELKQGQRIKLLEAIEGLYVAEDRIAEVIRSA